MVYGLALFFFKDIERSELLWGESCEKLKKPTFCQIVCEILIIISCSAANKYVIFLSRSKCIFSLFENYFSTHRSSPPGVVRKGVLKICSQFKREHPCQSATLIQLHVTLLKSLFSIDVLL